MADLVPMKFQLDQAGETIHVSDMGASFILEITKGDDDRFEPLQELIGLHQPGKKYFYGNLDRHGNLSVETGLGEQNETF